MFRQKAEAVLNSISKRQTEYAKDKLDQSLDKYSEKFKSSVYFSRWPTVKMNDIHYMCVSHPFMKLQLTSKFVAKVLNFAREDNPMAKGKTVMADFIGKKRLEPYFKELCDIWNPAGGHHDEYRYTKGEDSPDRIIFEKLRGKKCATLVQLKLKSLRETSHFTTSWQDIADDFAKSYSDCIFKSLNFLFRLEQAIKNGKANENHIELSKKILRQERFVFVGISPDIPPIFSICWAREVLIKEVENKINQVPGLKEWVKTKFPKGYVWHIMDLADFQMFMSAKERTYFSDEISSYIRKSGVDDIPLGNDGSMPVSFRTFIVNKYGESDPKVGRRLNTFIPELESLFMGLKDDTASWMFKKD